MYCENCGARIDDDSMFCENCGVLIATNEEREPEEEKEAITDLDELMDLDIGTPSEKSYGITDTDTQVFVKQGFLKESPIYREPAPEFEEPVAAEEEIEMEDTCPEPQTPEEEQPEAERKEAGSSVEFQEEKEEAVPAAAIFSQPEVLKETEIQPEPQPVSEPQTDTEEPETVTEQESGDDRPLFCMACGRRLPAGAAFCDSCGTPTGEVAPAAVHRRHGQGIFLELMKGFFVKPAATIERAASEDAFLPGIVFLLIKDVILAILAAVFMGRLSATLGFLGAWITGGDAFGFGAKVFLIGIVLDALWIGLVYGAGRLFKGSGSIRELTGACGTASLLTAALLILSIVLASFLPAAAICAEIITAAATVVFMTKAASQAMNMEDERSLYAVPAAFACYCIIIFAAIRIFG